MKAINNLTIKQTRDSDRWQVISPSGKVLEEFGYELQAEAFARETLDYLTEIGRRRVLRRRQKKAQAA